MNSNCTLLCSLNRHSLRSRIRSAVYVSNAHHLSNAYFVCKRLPLSLIVIAQPHHRLPTASPIQQMNEFDSLNEKATGRWSANSISETDEFNMTNENDQNQFNFATAKKSSPNDELAARKLNSEILFTITNLDKQVNESAFSADQPVCTVSPSITIQTDEDDRSIGNVSEDNDFLPELNVVEQPKKLSLLLPETSNHNKNRRMSTPAMSTTSGQQNTKKARPKIPTLKIISPDLNALDLRSSVPLSPTSLCRSLFTS